VIDATTGELSFEQPAAVLTPCLTRTSFLEAEAWSDKQPVVQNPPHASWRIAEVRAAEHRFVVTIGFVEERLASVRLTRVDRELPSSWSEWDEAAERARKASHDDFLEAELGAQRTFAWGSVESNYDPRSGSSGISIVYVHG
jgi:hypothetical protein